MSERSVVAYHLGQGPSDDTGSWKVVQRDRTIDQAELLGLDLSAIEHHIEHLYGRKIQNVDVKRLGRAGDERPSLSSVAQLSVQFADQSIKNLVLRQPTPGPFGLEEPEDRARQCLLSYRSFSDTPKHPKALDVGMIDEGGAVVSLANASQFFLLEEFVEGRNYGDTDFVGMRDVTAISSLEWQRAEAFAVYLADLHKGPAIDDPIRYRRSLREIVGGGEGLMGIIDSFSPTFFAVHRERLGELEHACLAAARRLRDRQGRLRVTHGDFHPWNILFRDERDFSTIDKGRCHLNDPAIDVGAMLMSYLMLAIWQGGNGDAPAMGLAKRFLGAYIEASGDSDILTTLPLYTAMRATAAASPEFYPEMPDALRVDAFDLAIRIAICEQLDVDLACLDDTAAQGSAAQ